MMRPGATRSSVSKAARSMAGGRRVARATRVPTMIRRVAAATAAVIVSSSRAGRRSPSGASPRARNRWSKANTPSSPASSAACATASTRSESDWNDGNVSPTWTREPAIISDTRPSELIAGWPDQPGAGQPASNQRSFRTPVRRN